MNIQRIRDAGWLKQELRRGERFGDQLKMGILEFFYHYMPSIKYFISFTTNT